MARRLNISLPERTVALIDRVAGKGRRSALIDRAVVRYDHEAGRADLFARVSASTIRAPPGVDDASVPVRGRRGAGGGARAATCARRNRL